MNSPDPDRPYCPDAGEFVWIDFNPHVGREQSGRRPGLVLSPRRYNTPTRLCVVCPITSRAKSYPFEVPLPESGPIKGVVLADHVKSVSWEGRNTVFAGKAEAATIAEVNAKLAALLQIG